MRLLTRTISTRSGKPKETFEKLDASCAAIAEASLYLLLLLHGSAWVENILAQKLFAWRRAEHLFLKARTGFLALDAPYEIALSSIDLSFHLAFDGKWAELKVLAGETLARITELAEDPAALAELSLWQDALEQKSLERKLISQVRETVIERMVEHR